MTNEEAKLSIDYLKDIQEEYIKGEGYERHPLPEWYALDYAIKALEQEPCEDCISRQAVEKITWEEPSYTDPLNVLTEIREKVRALPSVAPEEKTGHWINNHTQCSKCEWGMEDDVVGSPMMLFFPYCPNCGVRMVEPQESEEV